MYNEHIFCEEYDEIKETIINIINCDDDTTDIDELTEKIQDLYDDGKMPSTQYDELMGYIQDL